MKTLKNAKCEMINGKFTMTADVADDPINELIVKRVSIPHLNPVNTHHHRHFVASSEGLIADSPRERAVILNDVLAVMFAAIAPATTFAPHYHHSDDPFKVIVHSEIPMTLQWQVSENPYPTAEYPAKPEAKWTDIPGENKDTLDKTKVKAKDWIRCVATNAAGNPVSSPPYQVK